MKYSKDKKVAFNPESHIYTKKYNKLVSATTLIGKFKNKFDEDFYSKKIAKKRGVTQDVILKEWKAKAKKSCDIGTAIHKIFEDYTLNKFAVSGGVLIFDYMDLEPEYLVDFNAKKEYALKFIKDFFITGRLTPVYTEHIVYNEFIAGQIDMICKDKNDNFYILDFKTNEKIEDYSYGKKMLGILKDIDDANFYHYCLQLSIYKELFTESEIKEMFLVHITSEKYELIGCRDLLKMNNLTATQLI